MITLVGALAMALVAASVAQPAPGDGIDGRVALILLETRQSGWATVTDSSNFVVSTKPAVTKGVSRRAWMRFDYLEPKRISATEFLTQISLYEADCAEGRIRTLTSNYYADRKMKEMVRSTDALDWNYVAPDTVGADILGAICPST